MRPITRRQFAVQTGTMLAVPLVARPPAAADTPHNNILAGGYSPEKLAGLLLARDQWRPFPRVSERAPWDGLPAELRARLVKAGESRLGKEWPALPAALFLEYKRIGNRSHYERVRNQRRDQLRELVIAECIEGRGRFLDEIANGMWTTCEETFWGVPAHLGLQKDRSGLPDVEEPVVDLFAAETSSLLAWADYLVGAQLDSVSPLVRKRIHTEIGRRVLTPCLQREDFWWMGLAPRNRDVNNWNPWINSNWLTSVLLMEEDAGRRAAAVHKILRSLDRFLAAYHDDGGCDEGPGYWFRAGASLFDCLELLHSATRGALDFYGVPLVREIGRYIVRAHIHDGYFINFADAPAKVRIAGDLVFRYGRRIGDAGMQALGAWAATQPGGGPERGDSMGRQLAALFNIEAVRSAPARQPLLRDVWLPGIQVMAARRAAGSPDGLYLAAQGGHNAESHNHNDVGNFIVYADGEPAIIDVGVETYSAKTFSSKRYEIWTMQSAYHNCPTIGGVMQAPGRQFQASEVACRASERDVEFSLNIAGAYPPEAGVESWKRVLRFDREGNQIELAENYALKSPAGQITLTLMTFCEVKPAAPGELNLGSPRFRSGGVRVLYDARVLAPKIEEITIDDARLKSAWGDRIFRVLLIAEKPPLRDTWRVRIVQG